MLHLPGRWNLSIIQNLCLDIVANTRKYRSRLKRISFKDLSGEKIKIAGLLHDLGKLKIPDEILDKPSALTPDEFNIIKIHAYETHQILSKINGLEEITQWASQHHENLNGTGYPYHHNKDDLPLPSRIIGAADIFQALAQDRPYRKGMKPLQILEILKDKVKKGDLDENVIKTITDNIQECWQISLTHSSKIGI